MLSSLIWENNYTNKSTFILRGKKIKHASNLLAGLALLGPSTTREIAKFILEKTSSYEYNPVRDKDSRSLEQIYYKLIHGRQYKKTGKRKLDRYPGLIDNGYVISTNITTNKKNKKVQQYFLTLKGCFFVLGLNFTNNEFSRFIKNASLNHLYFAYLNEIQNKISFSYVKKIFLDPISDIIQNKLINLDENLEFYFPSIAFSSVKPLENNLKSFDYQATKPNYDNKDFQNLLTLIENNPSKPYAEWHSKILKHYYPNENEWKFYLENREGEDPKLLYRAIQEIFLVFNKNLTGVSSNYFGRKKDHLYLKTF